MRQNRHILIEIVTGINRLDFAISEHIEHVSGFHVFFTLKRLVVKTANKSS